MTELQLGVLIMTLFTCVALRDMVGGFGATVRRHRDEPEVRTIRARRRKVK